MVTQWTAASRASGCSFRKLVRTNTVAILDAIEKLRTVVKENARTRETSALIAGKSAK